MSERTETIRDGQSIRLNILSGESVAVLAVSGTYNASIVQGAGVGVIATNATRGTYGPYPSGIIILLTASASSEIDFVIAVTPVIVSDTFLADVALDQHGLMLIGDSIMAITTAFLNQRLGYEMQEYPLSAEFWMQAFLKDKRFRRVYNHARSGRRAWISVLLPGQANYGAQDDVDLQLAACPGYDVLIGIGTNDMPATENRTSAQIIADITTIALKCKNAGRRVSIKSIIPRAAADATWTTAIQAKALVVNNGIRNLCHREGYGYIPAAEVLTDYTALTTFVLPIGNTVAYDNVHPNNRGARRIGKKLADYYGTLRPESPNYRPLHFIDDSSADVDNVQLLDNPLFNGTTGWTLNAVAGIITAVTNTVIASPDGVGNALQVDLTVNAAGFLNLAFAFWDNTPAVVAGNYLLPTARARISASGSDVGAPTSLLYLELRGELTGVGTDSRRSEIRSFGFGGVAGTNNQPIDEALDIDLTPTNPLIVTGNETGLNTLYRLGVYFSGAGSARFVIYGCGLYKLSASPYTDPVNWR